MAIRVVTARHISDRDGIRYYFCCAGCQATFDAGDRPSQVALHIIAQDSEEFFSA